MIALAGPLLYFRAVDRRALIVMETFHSLFYALHDGSVDISLGGIMRSLALADGDGRRLPHFAEVNSRNGFFLLGRGPRERFAWSELEGKEVISFAEAPTPW